jgi:hypothetical protein
VAIKTDEDRLATIIRLVDEALNEWKSNSLVDADRVRDQLLDIRQVITRDHPVLSTTTDATPTDDQVEVDDIGVVIHTR